MIEKRKRTRVRAEEDPPLDLDDHVSDVKQIDSSIFFYCDVTRASVLKLVVALREASKCAMAHVLHGREARVYLYIQSNGGDAYAGLSGMDHVRNCPVKVIAIMDGFIASAATFILLGASERRAMRHAYMLVHQLSTGFWGKYDDLVDEIHNSKQLMKTIRSIYRECTQVPEDVLRNLLKKELTMTADECLAHKFVHELL